MNLSHLPHLRGIFARPWIPISTLFTAASMASQGCGGDAFVGDTPTDDAGVSHVRYGDDAAASSNVPVNPRSQGPNGGGPPPEATPDAQMPSSAVGDASTAIGDASTPIGDGSMATGGLPAGWLYTMGNRIYVSDGAGGGSVWMGRGVNIDDLFLCGYNNNLQDSNGPKDIEGIASSAVSDWNASFVRVSLGMASYPTHTSWLADSTYKTTMTQVIDSLGASRAQVLVTLRTDDSFVGQDPGDPEPTGVPSRASNTPDATNYPTGTDAVYTAIVDSFANAGYVIFGLSNEPGGNQSDQSSIVAAMTHAVSVIRAEEDRLGVPHHLVSVQGTGYTADVSFYSMTPLAFDNVVYEVHGYPPATSSYTYSNIPVIIGEYGSLKDSASFYADVEAKHIPNLAWDLEPFSNCSPDLVSVSDNATNQKLTAWGNTVENYLASP